MNDDDDDDDDDEGNVTYGPRADWRDHPSNSCTRGGEASGHTHIKKKEARSEQAQKKCNWYR